MAAIFVATSAYPATAVVEQPRPFGYVVGDVMTQRVLLEIDGHELAPAELPKAERVNVWLERRPARIESLPDGHRWLALDYQVINAPQSLTTVNLPAFELHGAPDVETLRIAAWPISGNALTSGGSVELPDVSAFTLIGHAAILSAAPSGAPCSSKDGRFTVVSDCGALMT